MVGIEELMYRLRGETESVSIGKQVSSSSTESISYTAKADGKIEGTLQLRIYAGAENSLHITLEIVDANGEMRKELVTPKGKGYIDGDDDFYQWSISEKIHKGEKVRVTGENTDGTYAYDFRVNLSVNYEGRLG